MKLGVVISFDANEEERPKKLMVAEHAPMMNRSEDAGRYGRRVEDTRGDATAGGGIIKSERTGAKEGLSIKIVLRQRATWRCCRI